MNEAIILAILTLFSVSVGTLVYLWLWFYPKLVNWFKSFVTWHSKHDVDDL